MEEKDKIKCPICNEEHEISEHWEKELDCDFLGLSPGFLSYRYSCPSCGFFESSSEKDLLIKKIQRISEQKLDNPALKILNERLEEIFGHRPSVSEVQKTLGNLKPTKFL